jgi:hypothetical protein
MRVLLKSRLSKTRSQKRREFEHNFLCHKNSIVNIINSTHHRVVSSREKIETKRFVAEEKIRRRHEKMAKTLKYQQFRPKTTVRVAEKLDENELKPEVEKNEKGMVNYSTGFTFKPNVEIV